MAAKLGHTPQTLHNWLRKAQMETGQRDGLTVNERDRMKTLERENRELRHANEILRKASAYSAQAEPDRASSASGPEGGAAVTALSELGHCKARRSYPSAGRGSALLAVQRVVDGATVW